MLSELVTVRESKPEVLRVWRLDDRVSISVCRVVSAALRLFAAVTWACMATMGWLAWVITALTSESVCRPLVMPWKLTPEEDIPTSNGPARSALLVHQDTGGGLGIGHASQLLCHGQDFL